MKAFIDIFVMLSTGKSWKCIILESLCVSFFEKVFIANYTPRKRSLGGGVYRNQPVCLSVQSKLNLDHNFLTKSDTALILHKCIPCDKTFLSIPKFLYPPQRS